MNKNIRTKAYEKYQMHWMLSHGITINDLVNATEEWQMEVPKKTFDQYLEEYGFGSGSIWACFNEFLGAEYLDAAYMEFLLDKEEYEEWKKDPITCNVDKELYDIRVDTPDGAITAKVMLDSEYKGICLEFHDKEGCPGAILEHDPNKKTVLLRVYGPQDPDGDPIEVYSMKKEDLN